MPKLIDLTGKYFGKLTVIAHAGVNDANQHQWMCLCACGQPTIVLGHHLRYGDTSSCGCLGAVKRTHGESGSQLYCIWSRMITRCTNRNIPEWSNYGGRGITVCDRWGQYENFRDDMGHPKVGETLDRIDNNMGYELRNCRWATNIEQANNKRNTVWVIFEGELMTLANASRAAGIKRGLMWSWNRKGLSLDEKARWYLERAIQKLEKEVKS